VSSGVTILGDMAAQSPAMITVVCNRCDRRGTLRAACLLSEHGPNLPGPQPRRILAVTARA
jgi:hypothetical protein